MRSFFTVREEGGERRREKERPKDQFVTGREREEEGGREADRPERGHPQLATIGRAPSPPSLPPPQISLFGTGHSTTAPLCQCNCHPSDKTLYFLNLRQHTEYHQVFRALCVPIWPPRK